MKSILRLLTFLSKGALLIETVTLLLSRFLEEVLPIALDV